MNIRKSIIATALLSFALAGNSFAQTVEVTEVTPRAQVMAAKRQTLAIRYKDDDGTSVNMVGTSLNPQAVGKAEVKRKEGRTRVRLEMENVGNPQALGAYYTTYILWAVAPEGQADNLAELPVKNKFDVEVTTNFQTFGLIITAEPHSYVKLPSPIIVVENALRKGTEGGIQASQIEYSGDPGTLYVVSGPNSPSLNADYTTPLMILGARRAVEIARRAGAQQYADSEMREAEVKLAALEQFWPRERKDQEKFSGMAHDVMRLGEHKARIESERQEARSTIAEAQNEADRARSEAERAKEQTAVYRDALARAESEMATARKRVEEAITEADKAKAREELARAEAERARLEAQQAKQESASMQERLFVSLSEILETRREARGLIVNLSDVLFDFNQASLRTGAREKLSKLAGILIAYPGTYRIEIEGHTDAVGSQDYNQKLSEDRAAAVRAYLAQAGIPDGRIIAVRGFGKVRPVATNDTPEGRQMNRRVELVISDIDKMPNTNNR
jgi:outer membrane protein OmpA-like peptidoglycan-associated protein